MIDAQALDAVRIELDPNLGLVLPGILGLMMFAVALGLRLSDFAFLRQAPLRFSGAAATQILALPLLTLLIVFLLAPPASVALGMIVVACCPGGNVSNFLSLLARGDTALSVSLTATSSLLAALLTPVSILFWCSLYPPAAMLVRAIDVQAWPFIVQTTLILAIPLAAGMVFAHHLPETARRIRPALGLLGIGLLILLIVTGIGRNVSILASTGLLVLGFAVIQNALALLLGWLSGWALGFAGRGRRTLTIEVGIQNSGLGLVILLGQFQGLGGAVAITAIWGVWHLISGLVVAGGFRLLDRRQGVM